MSKILIITNHSYMLWQFRRELIERLMEEHEVILSMPFVGHEEDFHAMGLRCIETSFDRRSVNPRAELRLLSQYRRILKEERPDLVITYSIKPNIYAGLLCSCMNIPYFSNVQGLGTAFQRPGLARVVSILYKQAFRKVHTVFFENEGDAATFQTKRIIPREKEVVLQGAGVNLERYAFAPYPDHAETRFLFLGRIMREKGVGELFGAMRRLHQVHGSQVRLEIVGFYEDDYSEQIAALERDGIAVFHGFQQDPRPFYVQADCLVMPSYHEGMSNVLLEAASTGRPLITTDVPGCREAVENGVSGLLCRVMDEESLYQAMERFVSLNREQRAAMGLAGRRKMERDFDKDSVVTACIRAMSEVLEEPEVVSA